MEIFNESLKINMQAAAANKQYVENLSLVAVGAQQATVSSEYTKDNFMADFIGSPDAATNGEFTDLGDSRDQLTRATDVQDICDNFEQDSRRYGRYLGNDSRMVML